MNNKLGMSGQVTVTVDKGKNKQTVKNAISSEFKNVIASSLQGAQDFKMNVNKFENDNFTAPTNNENGIMVSVSGPSWYETKTTGVSISNQNNTLTVTSSTRADGASYTFTGAKIGHGYGSNDFDYTFATTSFSQAVNDGQQLDLTWVITLT